MRKLPLLLFTGALLGLASASVSQQSATDPTTPADKSALPPKGIIHDQDVSHVPETQANHPCSSYSWAASLATTLIAQHAPLRQDFWADKYYGGDVCIDQMGTPEDLIRKGEGEYVLEDGRHVELKMDYFAGIPSNVSSLLVPIMKDEILIVFTEGKAELLIGAKWDEYQSPRGERMIDLKELHLLDPLLPADKQRVVLDATGDELTKISGYMRVKSTEVHQQYWPK
jgi:hypothetical protein